MDSAAKLGLPAAACTADKPKAVGAAAGKSWTQEKLLVTIERLADGTLGKVWLEPGSNTVQRASFLPEEEPHLLSQAHIKYSLACKGAMRLQTGQTLTLGHALNSLGRIWLLTHRHVYLSNTSARLPD